MQKKVPKKNGRPIEWDEPRIENERLAMEEWFKDKSHHSLTGFAHSRGYGFDWLKELSEKTETFTRSYKKAKEACEERISNGALYNKMNPTMAIFMLKCNFGWKEAEKEGDKGPVLHVHLPEIEGSKKFPVPDKK